MRIQSPRRWLMLAIIALAAVPATARAQPAADWPIHPVRIIIPQPPGGALDLIVRALTEPMRAQLGQLLVVDNRPGGNSVVGLEACALAAPDGYTLCGVNVEVMSTYPFAEPALFARYATLLPVTEMVRNAGVLLANPSVPVTDLRGFVAWARGRGDLNYSSSGQGSAGNLVWEFIAAHDGLRFEQVPYRGIIEAFNEMAAGRVQVSYINLGSALQSIAAGRVRALAVLGDARVPALPNVPSLHELGYEFPYTGPWWGLAAPAGTPPAVLVRMAAAVRAALADPALRTRVLEPNAFEPVGSTPAEFAALIAREREQGEALVRAAGVGPR